MLLGIVCTVSHHRIDDAGQLCAAGYLGGLLTEAVIFLFGLNPYEYSLNVGSNIGDSFWTIACWTILSTTVGMPSFLTPPFGFGISTLLTGRG